MSQDIIHVYFMPGMAASSLIFEHIKLPEDSFQMHYLEWLVPEKNETLQDYAKRTAASITHENVVLAGVSFGGVLVQEMSKFVSTRKVLVISSVKSRGELPNRMKLAKFTNAYKLIPTKKLSNIDVLAKYAFGKVANDRIELYRKYLLVNDPYYLEWAIKQLMFWKPQDIQANIVHIHGDKDKVFPTYHLKNFIPVKGGSHIMIINKYKWFNENLAKIILDEKLA
ncbi:MULTISPECIES: alpha/beta hydrolase [Corallibacter]|uniref:Alpha/beta hydrolase n=1 Tax=Corallibacter vietnamensis TaxID=904130 RepID=A0ABP7HCA5_9FLAO